MSKPDQVVSPTRPAAVNARSWRPGSASSRAASPCSPPTATTRRRWSRSASAPTCHGRRSSTTSPGRKTSSSSGSDALQAEFATALAEDDQPTVDSTSRLRRAFRVLADLYEADPATGRAMVRAWQRAGGPLLADESDAPQLVADTRARRTTSRRHPPRRRSRSSRPHPVRRVPRSPVPVGSRRDGSAGPRRAAHGHARPAPPRHHFALLRRRRRRRCDYGAHGSGGRRRPPPVVGALGGTRTSAHGSGGRCSIR